MWHRATTHFNHGRQQSATFSRGSHSAAYTPQWPPRRDRAPVVGPHVWMVCASRQPWGSECKPKWIWAADLSVDCCCTEAVDSSCKAALTLRNISWFRTERFGFCPDVGTNSNNQKWVFSVNIVIHSWKKNLCDHFWKSLFVILDSSKAASNE